MKKPDLRKLALPGAMTTLMICSMLRAMILGATFAQVSSVLFVAGLIASFAYMIL